jgi:hypothetical protein
MKFLIMSQIQLEIKRMIIQLMIVARIVHHHQIHLGTYFAFFYFIHNSIDFLRKRGRYSNDFKNKVLIYASTNGNDETLEKYNFDRRRLKEWQNKKENREHEV